MINTQNTEDNLDDIDNKNNTLLNKGNNPVELGFIIDKNENFDEKGKLIFRNNL